MRLIWFGMAFWSANRNCSVTIGARVGLVHIQQVVVW